MSKFFQRAAVAGWLCALSTVSHAQPGIIDPNSLSALSAEERQQLLRGLKADGVIDDNQPRTLPQPIVVESKPSAAAAPPKRIESAKPDTEDAYLAQDQQPELLGALSRKEDRKDVVDREPRPFGYDLFSGESNTFAPATDIPVPTDFVIGPGDNVKVQLFGKENRSVTLLVGRDGAIDFPQIGPIQAAGLSFEELEAVISERVAENMIGTTASVTLGRLRSIQAFILGDAKKPGSYTVSALSTMTHLLYVAGGINESGSLRKIQLKRRGRLVGTLDLYDLLLAGDSSRDYRLEPGDVVFIPPVGPRATVEGEVNRPAIYEISREMVTLESLIARAGGLTASTDRSSVLVERIEAPGTRRIIALNVAEDGRFPIQNGDRVRVRKLSSAVEKDVRVIGAVKYPGTYPWTTDTNLKSILTLAGVKDSDETQETYFPLGAIERTNGLSGARELVPFSLNAALNSSEPIAVYPKDMIIVLTRTEVEFLSAPVVEAVLGGALEPQRCKSLKELVPVANTQRAIRFLRALSSGSRRSDRRQKIVEECPKLFEQNPRLLTFLLDRSMGIYGEVARPGIYPIAEGSTLFAVLAAAGGQTRESDSNNLEYESFIEGLNTGKSKFTTLRLQDSATPLLTMSPGDVVTFRPVYLDQIIGVIRLLGEFRFPGTYSLRRGETLSKVIERAGGLTENAYPYGAVFTRESARKAEQVAYQRAAADLQEASISAVTSGSLGAGNSSATAFLQGAIQRLEATQAVGRVVIEADPNQLTLGSRTDIPLEAGDVLYVPLRSASVSVIGQVLNPGTVAYESGTSAAQYIASAGGFSQGADDDRAFVIYPNGAAEPVDRSWIWNKQEIPTGSIVVVPRDALPFNGLVLTEKIAGIFANLAISAAALVTINR